MMFLAVPRQLYRFTCHWQITARNRQITARNRAIVEKHYHTALWETFDPWDMWWAWWGYMTWPTKRPWQRQNNDKDKPNDKNIKRTLAKSAPGDLWPLILLIRVMRRYDLTNKKDNDNDKDNGNWRTSSKNNPRDLWALRHWFNFWQLRTKCLTFTVTLE